METLEEEQSNSTTTVDQSAAKTSLPTEVIEDILSRLSIKSILRFRSVSKPWLSRISGPSFTKLHFTRAIAGHRTALFISAHDFHTCKRYYLSAAPDGGPLTHLMTVDDACSTDITAPAHLNGLVCFTCVTRFSGNNKVQAFVLNPSTRQIFKLLDPVSSTDYAHFGYLFGFDESRYEHKILLIRKVIKTSALEFMIFSLLNHSWRKIDVEPPTDFSWDRLSSDLDGGVCVNSVVHVMLQDLSYDILAFDFITEKLSVISIPQGVVPHRLVTSYARNGEAFMKQNIPRIMNFNGCLGVVCHDRVAESNEFDIWMLQDYENRVWVRETIRFPESWNELSGPFPLPVDVHMDDIIFSPSRASENVMIVPIYNRKSRCSRTLQLTLDDQFLCSEAVKFDHINCYVESVMRL